MSSKRAELYLRVQAFSHSSVEGLAQCRSSSSSKPGSLQVSASSAAINSRNIRALSAPCTRCRSAASPPGGISAAATGAAITVHGGREYGPDAFASDREPASPEHPIRTGRPRLCHPVRRTGHAPPSQFNVDPLDKGFRHRGFADTGGTQQQNALRATGLGLFPGGLRRANATSRPTQQSGRAASGSRRPRFRALQASQTRPQGAR